LLPGFIAVERYGNQRPNGKIAILVGWEPTLPGISKNIENQQRFLVSLGITKKD